MPNTLISPYVRASLHEKATYETTISQLHQDIAAHKSHMQVLANQLDQIHFEVESKCEAFLFTCKSMNLLYHKAVTCDISVFRWICAKIYLLCSSWFLTDNAEVQDLKECLLAEQEEKNELNRKIQHLEKECKGLTESLPIPLAAKTRCPIPLNSLHSFFYTKTSLLFCLSIFIFYHLKLSGN